MATSCISGCLTAMASRARATCRLSCARCVCTPRGMRRTNTHVIVPPYIQTHLRPTRATAVERHRVWLVDRR